MLKSLKNKLFLLFFIIIVLLFPKQSAASSPCTLWSKGDLNCDGNIDNLDYSILFYEMSNRCSLQGGMETGCGKDANGDGKAMDSDLNKDGKVDHSDYDIWSNWYIYSQTHPIENASHSQLSTGQSSNTTTTQPSDGRDLQQESDEKTARNIKLKVAYKFNCSDKRYFDVERMQIAIKKMARVRDNRSKSYKWLGRKYYGTLSKGSPCQPLHIFTLHPSPQGELLSSNIPTQEILAANRDPNTKIVVDLGLLIDKYVQCPSSIPFQASWVAHETKIGNQEIWVVKARDPKKGTWLDKTVCYTTKWQHKTVEITDPAKVDYLNKRKVITFNIDNSLQPTVSYIIEPLPTSTPTLTPTLTPTSTSKPTPTPTPSKVKVTLHFKVVANNLDPKRRVIAQVIPKILPGNVGRALCSKQYAYWVAGSWPGVLEQDLVCNLPWAGFDYYNRLKSGEYIPWSEKKKMLPYKDGFKAEVLVEVYSYYYEPTFVGRAEWIKKYIYITSPKQKPTISLTITNPPNSPPSSTSGQ